MYTLRLSVQCYTKYLNTKESITWLVGVEGEAEMLCCCATLAATIGCNIDCAYAAGHVYDA